MAAEKPLRLGIGVQRATTTDRFATKVMAAKGVDVVRDGAQNAIYLELIAGRRDGTPADAIQALRATAE